MSKDIVLAFSGGLDTSFCIPWLQERGWAVHTVFADTGGVDTEEREYIEQRVGNIWIVRNFAQRRSDHVGPDHRRLG